MNKNKKPVKKTKIAKQGGSAPYLTLIIPCYNEDKLIEDTLATVSAYLSAEDYSYEVIVVDDGSRDRTVEISKIFAKTHPEFRVVENIKNRGKGFSVKNGFLNARGEYACFTDADLSTPVEEISKLLKWYEDGYDVGIGSRSIKGSDVAVHQPWWRELMGKTFNLLVQLLTIKGIKDTQCGFKGFSKKAYKDVFPRQRIEGFGFDVETLFIAEKHGYRIKEIPVQWFNRFESRVNPLIHPFMMMMDLVKIRLNDIRGRYK